MRRIVIAPDSFKGSLSSSEVAAAIREGIKDALPGCETATVCMSDGGDGMISAMEACLKAEKVHLTVQDPLGRPAEAVYLIADGTAIIEMAQASGLTCIRPSERNPLKTSTHGTGEMILDAYKKGCRKFIIGLGGSATNDAGCGMMEALGWRFLDSNGHLISRCCGETLKSIAQVDRSSVKIDLSACRFIEACDVAAVFTGPEGAARVFAAQKGADKRMIEELEAGMKSYEKVIREQYGVNLSEVKGSGAAGGLGGCFLTFFNAEIKKGSELILELTGFDSLIKGADLVITGEGKIDSQTFMGKIPSEIARRAALQGVETLAIGGLVELSADSVSKDVFKDILAIQPSPRTQKEMSEAMKPETTKANIRKTISRYFAENI
ncbi:MAG: glycerate kinase [Bacteroidales bacterium]|nr:glycerate kinase [Bacteroidales bacterium]